MNHTGSQPEIKEREINMEIKARGHKIKKNPQAIIIM